MQSNNPAREDDLLPFGAPQADATDPAVLAKLASASGKPQRSPRALRPLWYSIPFLVIALAISAYLIGITRWDTGRPRSTPPLRPGTRGKSRGPPPASSSGSHTTTWVRRS